MTERTNFGKKTMKKSVIAQPPVNCRETTKIYGAEVFMSLLERLQNDKFIVEREEGPRNTYIVDP